jgi:hypothetical protein
MTVCRAIGRSRVVASVDVAAVIVHILVMGGRRATARVRFLQTTIGELVPGEANRIM